MANIDVHFSSATNEWATPQALFDALNERYTFTLDPCSDGLNAKCAKFFTIEDDGLAQDWSRDTVFMNPPYGRAIGEWIRKAYEESLKGATVVCLIPSRTDTKYWHDYVMKADEICLIRGRVKFGGSKQSAPFPSAIITFSGAERERERERVRY
ncbi:phage N-6-adenine-methyltransferase [Macrococcus capreoli]|uniref:phage N-6-adenine-methyltransferase n=1 Tax=Macrococcus capreoli TaxID=2982690 RepID=UPI0021D577CE|nr:phage N-6-adenine-methyltransferase [Macrococcus sp. TMW 2.2395]MCU7556562.1 phage N-6-adenine-methyltransferase [Macrococcus sp. TMW 2.2395]